MINGSVLIIHRFLCLAFCIFSFHRRTMLLVCDSLYGCRLGCADCAFGSWSNPAKVIGHDLCEIICRDFCHDHMLSIIFCCCHYGRSFYPDSSVDRRDSALDFLPV
jgi:hypothetical protein